MFIKIKLAIIFIIYFTNRILGIFRPGSDSGVRKTYPKDQVRVLNIIGDIGNHSDGRVENISSESLKYLVGASKLFTSKVKFLYIL